MSGIPPEGRMGKIPSQKYIFGDESIPKKTEDCFKKVL
jgi:hypothetical protein